MATPPILHTRKLLPRAWLNRGFAFVYTIAIFALFYHHFLNLIHSPNTLTTVFLILADLVLSFMWITYQAFHLNPIRRQVFPENLPQVAKESEYPALDVFICTADPFKEPPIGVVNTALSVLAYDYPVDKLSVYVSDDGGSQLTLFAFMEAAKFARHWLPYCKKNNIVDRCPEVYFEESNQNNWFPETREIKVKYDTMKERVEKVMEKGSVCPDYISDDVSGQPFTKWTNDFTTQHHPPIIQVLLDGKNDKNVDINAMPNLIYISREKSKFKPHNFKAGALNVLLRVSSTMTNAPIFLILDCDMYSNDPKTPLRALCYLVDPNMHPKLAFVQFPQRFRGINKDDIYSGEFKIGTKLDPLGFDGLLGPYFMGTGAFFRRPALFGAISSSDIPQVSPIKSETADLRSNDILELAHHVAGCNYEDKTKWGSEIGFRYGCLVEDMFTSYLLHCEGWISIFCNPARPAFLGNSPIILDDFLTQVKRWYMGFLQMGFSKYSPITFGLRSMNLLQALCYVHYTCWPFWSIPIVIYAFLPQLMLIYSFPIFPKEKTQRNERIYDQSESIKRIQDNTTHHLQNPPKDTETEVPEIPELKDIVTHHSTIIYSASLWWIPRVVNYHSLCISSVDSVRVVSDPWFFLYAFLFLGAYGKHLFDFTIDGGPILKRWWNSQRMWVIWGVSSFPFGLLEYLLKSLGIATFGFNVTSKVIDKEQGKRYEQGMFEFGVASPMFFAIAIVATVNLLAFVRGISLVMKNGSVDELFVQVFIAGFVVVNGWPVYEAMVLRSDEGKMPLKVTFTSVAFAWLFFVASSLAF